MPFVLEDTPKPRFVLEDEAETNPTSRTYSPPKGAMKQDAKNAFGGLLRGAGSIGATIGTIGNALTSANMPIEGKSLMQDDRDSRQAIDDGLQNMGVDTSSGLYSVGKLGTEIAGTAGLGGVLAPALSKLPMLSNSLRTGGFSLGGTTGNVAKDMGIRMAGGAGVGGASVAAVDPAQTGTGAVLGALTPPAIKGAAKLGSIIPKSISGTLGVTTGAGGIAVKEAFNSGKKGATNFLENMRGSASFDDVVAKAKQGLSNLRMNRQTQYRAGMLDISKDKAVLNFSPIDKAVNEVSSLGSYKGVQINKNASSTVDEVVKKVQEWKSLPPAEYHTPEGLDSLKRAIGDIRDTTQYGTAARRAVDQVYNAVKGEIVEQAPVYSKVMKDYSNASDAIKQVEKSLSLNPNAMPDTAIRKLQSVLRNNAQTSYGNRLSMVEKLQEKGAIDVMPDLAGQAMNSWTPRGMVGAIEKAGAPLLAYTNPASIAALPLASPRLVGEAAYKLGSVAGGANKGANAISKAIGLNGQNGQNGLFGLPASNYLPLSILESQTSLR